ncbi:O-antigen ligase family protein [Plebeiibacterium marinum]|uniref:O-antigen ligase family protein n=1 Tax=Plebeiibacterium marinum TaxID=2992111 RepID=A0AAE3MGV2_9BACT|nr:O-antigen ligase family protein [Plebeiobacterium marinum]MCW3807476.1 O-antigen ligase family protein [Plebeiobacterium marinum]
MIDYIQKEKKLFLTLLFWMLVGIFSATAAMVIIPIHIFLHRKKESYLLLLLGLWFLFILSDSRQYIFHFAQSVKPLAMVVTAFLIWEERNYWPKHNFYIPFTLFFIITLFCLQFSPIKFKSLQKMLSYFLLLYIVPHIVQQALYLNKVRFLKGIIATGALILIIGLALKYISPSLVMFKGGRYNGLLGNPNGLGIFAFCFFMMYLLIYKYHKHYFFKSEHLIILSIIGLSLILAGSRGGIFSSSLFLIGYFLFERSITLGFIVLSSTFISYQLVTTNLIEIIDFLGLQEYFRLNSLEEGSGRLVAFEFAWKQIQNNYWIGKGFGYTDYLMYQYKDYFLGKGHQGNVHNSYLTIWLNSGLLGLLAFLWGWLKNFYIVSLKSPLVWAVLFGVILSTTVESWLAASMNPFTIQLVIILSLLGNPLFYKQEEKEELGLRI